MTQTPDPEEAQAAIEYCYAQGWSDGLPLVPASQPLVEKFLATTSRNPDEVIGELEQVGRNCTVYLAAVNAAMAGCLPEYFPVVLAAFDALMRERAARGGGWQSTSGPPDDRGQRPGEARTRLQHDRRRVRPRLPAERHRRPRHRPDRPRRLRIRPHVLEQATQGLPAGGRSAWRRTRRSPRGRRSPSTGDGRRGERRLGDAPAHVRVRGQPAHPGPRARLNDIADTISRTGSLIFRDTSAGVVFCPEHAQLLAAPASPSKTSRPG